MTARSSQTGLSSLPRPDDARYAGRVQNWARNFISGPVARYGVTTTPPTITFGGNASTVNSNYVNGNTVYTAQSPLLTAAGSRFVPGTAAGGYPILTPAHITNAAGVASGGTAPIRYRFATDATAIDFCFLDQLLSQFDIIVDGQYVARDRTAVFGNTGNYRYVRCDFGADVVTYAKVASNFTIAAGGTGHAVGDVITLNGGSNSAGGTPCTVKVGSLGANGAVGSVDVVNKGAYTSLPTGTFSQAATTGSGTGFQLTATFFHPQHSTRRMRTIELVYSPPATFLGIVVGTNDVVTPYPVNPACPKLAVVGDSITIGTYLQYGGSHMACSIAQKLGLWDKLVVSGVGGSGWITAGPSNAPWSDSHRIADYIADNADIYLFIGSQNDATASTALQNAVTATLNTLMTARPNAFIVGIGNIMGDSTSLANSIGAGFAAATRQDRITYLNNHTPAKWIPSADQASWAVNGDLNHPSQNGLDRFAEIASQNVYNALMAMAA